MIIAFGSGAVNANLFNFRIGFKHTMNFLNGL
jgi:hypothetical protein